eukprot:TRINITY_DN77_c0_g1_i13.p1 TRINITY_DN77_c0_g1~~TRINITY_DN77_c0_g1_i13.p1  ORF type:complete len:202 (-),score=52.60 TRINITY_DN77_c0_g1_i13:27-587(-)
MCIRDSYRQIQEEYEGKREGGREETKRGRYNRRGHKHHELVHRPRCSKRECLTNLRDEIHEIAKNKIAVTEAADSECNVEREQLYQLLGLVDGMNVDSILQCEYLMNFGVSLSLKKHLDSLLNGNDGHIKDEDEFFALNLKEILIIHKYLDTAVQKLNGKYIKLSLIHICRCRRSTLCRSRWSPYH